MTDPSSRRYFLTLCARMSALGATVPLALHLSALRAASDLANPNDYRAIVLVYLNGGNDHYNTIIPYDQSRHTVYQTARRDFAVSRDALSDTVLTPEQGWGEDYQFALNPKLAGMKILFDEGALTPVMRLGTLLQPVSIEDYQQRRFLPEKLMSHNDQASLWQSQAVEGATSGWGGRMGDLIAEANAQHPLLSNISVDVSTPFSAGQHIPSYLIPYDGPAAFSSGSRFGAPVMQAIENNLTASHTHLMHQHLAAISSDAVSINPVLRDVLEAQGFNPEFPMTTLGARLSMVAQLINARDALSMKRQVFMVTLGGFDAHKNLGTGHPVLLEQIDVAMMAFQRALDAMGIADKVVTFTGSDFGRSLVINGMGSDHGWAGHQLLMSRALKPRNWIGALPSMVRDGPDDVGQGRLLPALGVQQLGATLAQWMGVPDHQLNTVFPGLENFSDRTLDIFG